MSRSVRKALTGEFIGVKAEVVDSTDASMKHVRGEIIDETRNTFLIEDEEKVTKMVPKKDNKFKLYMMSREIIVDGSKIMYRPEDRIKRLG